MKAPMEKLPKIPNGTLGKLILAATNPRYASNVLMAKSQRLSSAIIENLTIAVSKPRYTSKVFCIGFNKTGTTSFGKALQMLGYRHSSFNKKVWSQYYKNDEVVKILRYTAKFDSVDDLPWLKEDMIPVLDRVFPNSKFVYLTRDEASWKKSIYNWTFKVFGEYPNIDEKLDEYRRHREFVFDYFKDKPKEQFLVLDVSDGGAFGKLADFLGKTAPQKNFPHYNKTSPSV